MDNHGRKIRSRKQGAYVGKYSSVNRTIKVWNRLPAGTLASFPCELNAFRNKQLQAKRLQVGIE
jgi:hypothetical protein